MANIAQAQLMLSPSFIEPGILLPYTQSSGAFETLADGQPLPKLSEGDLMVYMKRIDLRTRVAAGQASYNQLPSVSTMLSWISTPTYELRVRAEYDHHDTAAFGRWGVSIAETQRLGMRQAHFQLARSALLYGFNPANGEGILNTPGATSINLPADSNGNQTVVTYDNGQMGTFLLSQVQALLTRTNQLGQAQDLTLLGPQRVLGAFAIQNIVQVTQYQRPGAGTETTAGMVKGVLGGMGININWTYDDTLIGKGAGGTDAVILIMPTVKRPVGSKKIDTNTFADLAPGIAGCSLMYCDMAAPREIPTPLPGGAIDILSEWRISSGWVTRSEVVTIISMQYQ